MASLLNTTGRRCPSGRHIMDPGWDKCPYCDAESRSTQQTAYQKPSSIVSSDVRKTTIADSSTSSNRETKTMPQQNSSQKVGGYGGRSNNRRIEGILITYTWRPEGDLFAICSGKNYIGAGKNSFEPDEPPCDIQITDDPTLSSAHALILCRQGKIQITDLNTTNGTALNGELLPMHGEELPDIATITTGSTTWQFMKIVATKNDATKKSSQSDIQEKPTSKKKESPKTKKPGDTIIPH